MVTKMLEAMFAYIEQRRELQRQLDAYDGYSPDWHFSREIDERARLEDEFRKAFALAVKEALDERAKTPTW